MNSPIFIAGPLLQKFLVRGVSMGAGGLFEVVASALGSVQLTRVRLWLRMAQARTKAA